MKEVLSRAVDGLRDVSPDADVAVVSGSDPRDSRTWSGTPRNIVLALEHAGHHVFTAAVGEPPPWSRWIYTPAVAVYGRGARGFSSYYGPLHWRASRRATAIASNVAPLPTIHTDHHWLPLIKKKDNQYLFRDSPFEDYARSQGVGARLRKAIRGRELRAIEDVQHVFTTSEWCRERYLSMGVGESKVTAIGTGIGQASGPIAINKDYSNGRTLFVAKVRLFNKGVDLMLDGFSLARASNPKLTLDAVVPPEYHRDIPGVTFHWQLPLEQLNSLYREASLFALPARFEPWGLVYLEAHRAGIATLGSNRAAYPEISGYGRCGLTVGELSPLGVANSLLEAHSDPSNLATLGLRGIQNAASYSWEKTADTMLAIMGMGSRR